MESDPQAVEVPIPSTLDGVEKVSLAYLNSHGLSRLMTVQLILELYQPGPSRKIAKIQETLQKLQRSAEGWQLASSLLDSSDEKVKFFGALTFTVKLNLDS